MYARSPVQTVPRVHGDKHMHMHMHMRMHTFIHLRLYVHAYACVCMCAWRSHAVHTGASKVSVSILVRSVLCIGWRLSGCR